MVGWPRCFDYMIMRGGVSLIYLHLCGIIKVGDFSLFVGGERGG